MKFERLNDPVDVNSDQIAAILAAKDVPTIQFSKPLRDLQLLDKVDALCRTFGDRLEVRFYSFHSSLFDASILSRVPHVQWLSVDCLTRATGIEQLYALSCLRKLSLGIHELDLPDVLTRIPIKGLKDLRIIETQKNNIDLAPLEQCQELSHLFIGSHRRGIDVLRKLKSLTNLTLGSIAKKQSLAIVSDISELKKLRIVLGGREDINEISHSRLTELEVIRVLGLSSMGDLGRFPVLQKLRIEDQIRLEAIDLGQASSELVELALCNCKKLRHIGSIRHLVKLEDLGIGRTAIDCDALLATPLPASLKTARIWTGKSKLDTGYRTKLDSMDYGEFTKRN